MTNTLCSLYLPKFTESVCVCVGGCKVFFMASLNSQTGRKSIIVMGMQPSGPTGWGVDTRPISMSTRLDTMQAPHPYAVPPRGVLPTSEQLCRVTFRGRMILPPSSSSPSPLRDSSSSAQQGENMNFLHIHDN